MNPDALRQLADRFAAGQLDAAEFSRLATPLIEGAATGRQDAHGLSIDLDRRRRCGFPEVIFGEGKTPAAIAAAIGQLTAQGEEALVTRVTPDVAQEVGKRQPTASYNAVARTLRVSPDGAGGEKIGSIAVITAGTSDLPVAEEARETIDWMGVEAIAVNDVGVAGPHRLPQRLAEFESADAVVVVAGMEGALPSVVGGYVACPVIGVPTSVGYGANLGGLSALMSMLNSCAANVAVVNIDAGFKGGYMAGMIARRAAQARESAAIPTPDPRD